MPPPRCLATPRKALLILSVVIASAVLLDALWGALAPAAEAPHRWIPPTAARMDSSHEPHSSSNEQHSRAGGLHSSGEVQPAAEGWAAAFLAAQPLGQGAPLLPAGLAGQSGSLIADSLRKRAPAAQASTAQAPAGRPATATAAAAAKPQQRFLASSLRIARTAAQLGGGQPLSQLAARAAVRAGMRPAPAPGPPLQAKCELEGGEASPPYTPYHLVILASPRVRACKERKADYGNGKDKN
jgi:hypothetical protein